MLPCEDGRIIGIWAMEWASERWEGCISLLGRIFIVEIVSEVSKELKIRSLGTLRTVGIEAEERSTKHTDCKKWWQEDSGIRRFDDEGLVGIWSWMLLRRPVLLIILVVGLWLIPWCCGLGPLLRFPLIILFIIFVVIVGS